MAHVLFIFTNINGFHEDTYAFGLASIIAVSRKAGHECRAIVVYEKGDYDKVFAAYESFKPEVVAFSSVSSQFHFVSELAVEAKKRIPGVVTVCGGIHPTIYPQCIGETPAMDCVFVGEAEQTFPEFLGHIDAGTDWRGVAGVAYIDEKGSFRQRPVAKLSDNLDHLPFPDKEVYPYHETVERTGYAPFFFSRGCPFKCTYCSNHAIARANGMDRSITRYRSARSCIDEIKETIKRVPNIRKLAIVDDIFGINKKWRREFLDIYTREIKLPFLCLLRADVISEEFLRTLKAAGCERIAFGVESGNEHIRNEVMGRNMPQDTIIRAFDTAHAHGLQTNALNIIGAPGETEDMLLDTIKLNKRIRPTASSVNIFYPYRGTILGDKAFEDGLVDLEAFANFSNERRETVLAYTDEHKAKLLHYHKNWERLIYGFSFKRWFVKTFYGTPLWAVLRFGKRLIVRAPKMAGEASAQNTK